MLTGIKAVSRCRSKALRTHKDAKKAEIFGVY
jgi:hypothetical protein